MPPTTLEQRVDRLERIVEELRSEKLREPGRDDWRATIGAFSSDPVAKEIIDEALRLREAERQQPNATARARRIHPRPLTSIWGCWNGKGWRRPFLNCGGLPH